MKKVYCTAPWRGLHITTKGEVKPCCSGAHGLGNANEADIIDIVNNDQWRQLRQQILNNDIPEYCGSCVRQGDATGTERSWHNNVTPNLDQPGMEYHGPAILDVRWSNACNLICVYCNPNDSSMWAKKMSLPLLTKRKGYYENIIEFVQTHPQYLHTVTLIGGEPLLIPQCSDLLDAIPDSVEVHIITNLSIDLTNNVVFQKLALRSKVHWSVSFENVGKEFEYVRRGATWDRFVDNLGKLKQLKKHKIDLHGILHILSLSSLDKFVQLSTETEIPMLLQFLENPPVMDLRRFPKEIVESIKQKIWPTVQSMPYDWGGRDVIEHYFNNNINPTEGQIENFYNFIKEWDTDQLQFNQLWPELDSLLKSYMGV